MSNVMFNPYALLINSEIVEVVYMHDKDDLAIEEELKSHTYDEIVVCSEYGRTLYVGQKRYGDKIVFPQPDPDYVLCGRNELWYPLDPSEPRFLEDEEFYWIPETSSWKLCVECAEMKEKYKDRMLTHTKGLETLVNAN